MDNEQIKKLEKMSFVLGLVYGKISILSRDEFPIADLEEHIQKLDKFLLDNLTDLFYPKTVSTTS